MRVSTELRAKRPGHARGAVGVTLTLAIIEGIITAVGLYSLRFLWPRVYTHDPKVIKFVAAIVPVLSVMAVVDAFEGTLNGACESMGHHSLSPSRFRAKFFDSNGEKMLCESKIRASIALTDRRCCECAGVARGCGWQLLAACTNLVAFYGVGVPSAAVLAFVFNLTGRVIPNPSHRPFDDISCHLFDSSFSDLRCLSVCYCGVDGMEC